MTHPPACLSLGCWGGLSGVAHYRLNFNTAFILWRAA